MNLKTANLILSKTGGHWWHCRVDKDDPYGRNHIIMECNDILQRYGMRLPEFMDRIKIGLDGKIYWKAKTKFHLLQ